MSNEPPGVSPIKALYFLACVVVVLLAFVTVIATIQGTLNASAVIATLGSVLGGIVTGIALFFKAGDGDRE